MADDNGDLFEEMPAENTGDKLSGDLLEQIQAVYDIVGDYLHMSSQEFIAGFEKNDAPEDEVDAWMSVAAAWIAYHEQYLNDEWLPEREERQLLAALIAIATGTVEADQLGVAEDIGRRLLRCYREAAAEDEEE